MDLNAYGAALPEGLLIAFYRAPRLHFYDKWLAAFEQSVSALTITGSAAHP
jgi:hypothetical protein